MFRWNQIEKIVKTGSWLVMFKFHYVQMEYCLVHGGYPPALQFKFHYVQMESIFLFRIWAEIFEV